jgi:hypothetical protein
MFEILTSRIPHRFRWGALTALVMIAVFAGGSADLSAEGIINEIHYHPASDDDREEFIELYNPTNTPLDLSGWSFNSGINYTFKLGVSIPPNGFLVVSADADIFATKHPEVSPQIVFGPWTGRLNNRGESIRLADSQGTMKDRVDYANEGEFARRIWSTDFRQVRGIKWLAPHDGQGPSLELRQWRLSNNLGANWSHSAPVNGTPGRSNTQATSNAEPIITKALHSPPLPRSDQKVNIHFELHDESISDVQTELYYSINEEPFVSLPLTPITLSSDTQGIFQAIIPEQINHAVVEFYIQAKDSLNAVSTWPRPTLPDNEQDANAMYQVDDRPRTHDSPEYRIIMTPSERLRFLDTVIPRLPGQTTLNGKIYSDGRFHAAFISHFDGQYRIRYQTEVRNRGNGSRQRNPNNFRIDFASDDLWRQAEKLNLNAQFPWLQTLGAALSRQIGLLAAPSRLTRVYMNEILRAQNSFPTYEMYAANDVINSDFAARQGLGNANIYRGIRKSGNEEADLRYLGDDPDPYRRVYFKETNKIKDDWTDLIALTRAFTDSSDETFEQEITKWIDLPQWMRFLAADTFNANQETALGNGYGDDYYLYRSETDGLFRLIPYDQDTILGQGDTSANPRQELWKATRGPVTKRLLTWPNFAPLYYSNLVQLATGPLSEAKFKPFLKRILSTSNVPETRKDQLLTFARDRGNFILETVPRQLAADISLPQDKGVYLAASPTESLPILTGISDATRTALVTVNGQNANWNPVTARWAHIPDPLKPGNNRFNIQAIDANETVIELLTFDIYLPIENLAPLLSNLIDGETHWSISQSPIIVDDTLTLRPSAVLTIDPNVHIQFTPTGRLIIQGQMQAVGNPDQPIVFSSDPSAFWGGFSLEAGAEVTLDHVIIERTTENAISINNATLTASNTTWRQLQGRAIHATGASITLRDSLFQHIEQGSIITITHPNQFDPSSIVRCHFVGNDSGNPIVELIDETTTDACSLLLDNQFQIESGPALRILGAKAFVSRNHFLQKEVSETDAPLAVEIINSNPTVPLQNDLARNIFYQVQQAITTSGVIQLNVHNNTFDSIKGELLSVSEGATNAEWINNLHRSVLQGYLVVAGGEATLNLESQGNLSDNPINIATTLIPNEFLGLGSPESDWSLSLQAPARSTGRGGLDIGATANSFSNLTYLEDLSWPLFGASIPLWAPGIERFEIAETPLMPGTTVTTILNGAIWIPQSTESQPQSYQITAISRGRQFVITKKVVLNFDSNTPTVQLSELQAGALSTDSSHRDSIEIQNRVDRPVDLSGFALSDDPMELRKFVFPEGTILLPNGHLVARGSEIAGETNTLTFKLDPDGETVLLSDPASKVLDSIQFGRQIPNTSIARTDQNEWRLATPTPNAPNEILFTADPGVIQLSEYLTQPRQESSTGEFVEIYNPSPLPVSMEGISLSNEPEVDPAKQRFPSLSFIESNSYLLLEENAKNSELTFGLSSQPAAIGLFSKNGQLIDIVSHGPQFAGASEARNSNHELVFLSTPTPGLPNVPSITEQAAFDISLITPDHPWRFDQTGNDLGATWRRSDFDDQNWDRGKGIHKAGKELLPTEIQTELELGITTYYFRAQFDYDVLIAPRSAALHFIADDGAIIYLNDQEIARVRMPETGPVHFLTQALENTDSDWEGPFPFDTSLIRAGTNVVAIEVHQSNPESTDVAFGLSLDITVDSGKIDDVILSELLADNRSENGTDWVEIFNPSLLPVDLSQARLTDSLSRNPSWPFPPNTYITGFGRQVIRFNPNSQPNSDNTGFGLSASGDSLYLIEDQNSAARIIDSITFGLQTPNISLARVGPDQHWGPAIPTPNSDNLEAAVGDVTAIRINEWLARASQGPDWFEIYNPGNDIVDLSGIFLSDDFLSPFKHPITRHSFLGTGQHAWRQFIADSQPEDGADHVAFKLGGSGDNIALFTADGSIIDFVKFGPQESDQSEGLQPDGGTSISRFTTPSPALSNQTEQDADLDGMEDEWERVNGLDPNNPADAAIDTDADGLTNREEFLLGTDPRSETSGLRIDRIEHLAGEIAVTFSAIESRGYALQKRNDLQQAVWENVWTLDRATQTGVVAAVVESVSGQAFYRLILR